MTEKTFKKGDKVTWHSSGGTSHGTVEKKVTGTAKVKTHVAKADAAHPQYKVKTDSGKTAIHKPDALEKS